MSLDLPRQSSLLVAPFGCFAIKESGVDSSIEPIYVHRLDAALEGIVLNLESRNRLVATATFILLALSKCFSHPIDDLIVQPQLFQQISENAFDYFLPYVGLQASSAVSGAVIIDVFTFFDFAYKGAAAMAAINQT